MQQNEPKANRPHEAKIIEPCGDTDEVTILTRQKQDYRSVTRRGLTFNLTTRQAKIIGILHAAFKDGHPDVPQARILEEIQTGSRVRDSFRKSGKEIPAWKALVEQGERKGTFRL